MQGGCGRILTRAFEAINASSPPLPSLGFMIAILKVEMFISSIGSNFGQSVTGSSAIVSLVM
jgi:hypothetical protein